MKDVVELETRIAHITVSSAERRDEEKLYHALTIADLRTLAPFVSDRLIASSFFILEEGWGAFAIRFGNFICCCIDWK